MGMYYLCRRDGVSGKSGTGRMVQVAEFNDGTAVCTGAPIRTRVHSLGRQTKYLFARTDSVNAAQ